jgi:hypothetical protein
VLPHSPTGLFVGAKEVGAAEGFETGAAVEDEPITTSYLDPTNNRRMRENTTLRY